MFDFASTSRYYCQMLLMRLLIIFFACIFDYISIGLLDGRTRLLYSSVVLVGAKTMGLPQGFAILILVSASRRPAIKLLAALARYLDKARRD
jgi:hypothetical protein